MKILVDIGHPAHVHYFRNAIKILERKGHQFLVTTRDKEVTLKLLELYNIDYYCTGKNLKGVWKKFLSMIRNDWRIYKKARTFKPDLYLSFFSPFAAHVGYLLRKPVIGFTDTEFAKFSIRLTLPFTNYVFTPETFETDFGKKQIRFKGHMEGFYLHPNYFQPDKDIFSQLGLEPGTPYAVMRFVSFTAGHDAGETGISENAKEQIATLVSEKMRLFISSESELPPSFEKYRIRVTPDKFHSLLAFARLYIGEGITTASECALLGVPSVLINTLTTGYIKKHERDGLIFRFDQADEALPKIGELLNTETDKNIFLEKSQAIRQTEIDCTAYLVWMIENFPKSISLLQDDPKAFPVSHLSPTLQPV